MSNEKLYIRHPGYFLKEIIDELGISQYRLSIATGIPHSRVSAIINGTRGITAETAMRIGKFFKQGPEMWLGLQGDYDMAAVRDRAAGEIEKIATYESLPPAAPRGRKPRRALAMA